MNEFGYIRRLLRGLPADRSLLVGPGDDCAVLRLGGKTLLLTTDLLVEGVHFRRDWISFYDLAVKAVRVNLSDIAAMGGVPRYALISVGLPSSLSPPQWDGLSRGIREETRRRGIILIGGDMNASARIVISVALIGEAIGGRYVTRDGARAGDNLYVTGTLGDSALGLEILKHGEKNPLFVRRHLLPPSRIEVGRRLAQNQSVHSLIDVSDGLLQDLGHILEQSGVGAEVFVDRLPLSSRFRETAARMGLSPERLALTGGEDYELLFTAKPSIGLRNITGVSVTKIGRITPPSEGLVLLSGGRRWSKSSLKVSGYRHF